MKGSSGLLNKITFSGEDSDFLIKRQHALEVRLDESLLDRNSIKQPQLCIVTECVFVCGDDVLQIFLVRVSRHPVLRQSYWFHQFLENVSLQSRV